MAEITKLFLPEAKFDKLNPEDGARLTAALQETKDKINELLDFLKKKFPGEV